MISLPHRGYLKRKAVPYQYGRKHTASFEGIVVNDQVQPEDDTNPDAAEQVFKMDPRRAAEANEELLDDTELGDTEMSDEELAAEEFDDNDLESQYDDEGEFGEEDDEETEEIRSLVEELFDEDDLGEVMSELDVLTLEDAAAYLKVEYGQIRRLLKEQGLPGRKIGDEWRFLRGALADWLRAPGGNAPAVTPASNSAPAPEREERPAQQGRRDFNQKPPLRERFAQGDEGGQQRYPQQGGSRYPQQGGSRYPRRPHDGGQGQGGEQGGGYQGQGGGYQGQGGQGGYPPPRRPRYGNDQGQQFPQGEYRPPRRPAGGGQGSFDNQGGGGYAGGGARKFGGPKKPKRKALNEQRFKRLDRRRGDGDSAGSADSHD